MGLISQLINGTSRVLQILFKYFNGTAISTSFVLPLVGIVVAAIFVLNYSESIRFLSSPSLAANNCAAALGASRSGSGPASPVIAILPFTSIYASL